MQNVKRKIVILGMGFAGAHAAIQLSKALKDRVQIIVVDLNNYHLFKPMLHEFATGSVEPGHIIQPIRQIMKGRDFSFEYAIVQKIDLSQKLVHLCEDCLVCHQKLGCPI